jgi:hydrogenase nickel incorporation protein HypA/HybF
MHELSLCASILQSVEAAARKEQFSRVIRVRLEVGPFAGVELEALRFGFDVVTRQSVAEGASLDIVELPGRAWCLGCSQSVVVSQRFDPCPSCSGHRLQVTGGDELRIKDLEVE